jgi:hypothetical protein
LGQVIKGLALFWGFWVGIDGVDLLGFAVVHLPSHAGTFDEAAFDDAA